MAQKKYTRGNKNSSNDLVGIILVIISAFFLLCLCIPVILGPISRVIRHVTVGVFGFMAYPIFLCMLLLGIALIQKRKLRVAPKTVVAICAIVFFVSLILQLATSQGYLGNGISAYISGVYNNFTAGGVFFGIFAYAIQSVIMPVFTYIVCSLCILLIGGFMLRDKLGFGKKKAEDDSPMEIKSEFRKGINAPAQVQHLPDKSLFVDIIQPVEPPHDTEYGTFTQLSDNRQEQNMQSYSSPQPIQTEKESGFIPYNTNYSDAPNTNKKEWAKNILYGDRERFQIAPNTTAKSSTSDLDIVGSSTPGYRPGIIPPHVFGEQIQPQTTEPQEPEKKKPEKVLHIEDIPELKKIHFAPEKDISKDYVGGKIINGDALSQEIAEKNAATLPERTGANISALPRTDDFYTRKYEPTQITPRTPQKNYDFTDSRSASFDAPKQSESERNAAPIINGDYVGKTQEPTTLQEPPMQIKKDEPIKSVTDSELEKKYEAMFGTASEPITRTEPVQNDIGALQDDNDDVIDNSEYGFDNPNDSTGMYNQVPDSPLKNLGLEFIVEGSEKSKTETGKKKLDPKNQISIEGYAKEITKNIPAKPKKRRQHYNPPPIELLSSIVSESDGFEEDSVEKAQRLENTLHELKLPATVKGITRGPAVTRYELEMPPGIPVKRIGQFVQDIEYSLEVNGHIRLETPIPGKRAVGVEVPNKIVDVVSLHDVIDTKEFANASSPLTVAMGKDIAGANIFCALDKMPHLLVAGATGTGKSVCLNAIIISLLYKSSPEDMRIILIDPKQVEFSVYRNMPHLLGGKIITDARETLNAFKYLRQQMEDRYKLFSKNDVRNIQEYNKLESVKNGEEEKMPYIVLIVDELADLLMSNDINRKDLESLIQSLAQKARAAGIHLILATQRPSVDVITGTIKVNLPSRIAFSVRSAIDSCTILDQGGAETLLGRGDMLYAPVGVDEPRRVQGAFVTNEEVSTIVEYVRENNEADFDEEFIESLTAKDDTSAASGGGSGADELDPLMPEVLKLVIETGTVSTTFIQRRFAVGYARAARIMDQMEMNKFVGPSEGAKPRQIYISREQYKEMYGEEI